jgi:hypothetical protein
MNPRIATPAAVLLGVVGALVGCGPPAAKLVPAAGRVTIGGRPAAAISVQFLPDDVPGETRPTSFAVTDAEGMFQLKTYDGQDGAVEGSHTVLLVDTTEERPSQGESAVRPPRVDASFSTVAGGYRCEVTAGGDPIEITLD